MVGHDCQFQVEVWGLAGQLGTVSLGPGRVTAWDLVRLVHSEFPLPCGIFWKLVIEDEPITSKDTLISKVSAITCVKISPAKHEQEDAVRLVEEFLCSGRSLEALPLEAHMIWLTLQSLTFSDSFNQKLANVSIWQGVLRSLTCGRCCKHSKENVTLPSGLQSLTFGHDFNQPMDNVTLPSSLQNLTFGHDFNQCMDNVTLPNGLRSLTFGANFNQNMDNVTLPRGLQNYNHPSMGRRCEKLVSKVSLKGQFALQSLQSFLAD